MTLTFKEEFESALKYAIRNEEEFFAVKIFFEDTKTFEIIINPKDSLENKLAYYSQTYDNELIHKHAKHIRIMDFAYGQSLADIETAFMY